MCTPKLKIYVMTTFSNIHVYLSFMLMSDMNDIIEFRVKTNDLFYSVILQCLDGRLHVVVFLKRLVGAMKLCIRLELELI